MWCPSTNYIYTLKEYEMETKECKTCGEEKGILEYEKGRRVCKKCRVLYKKRLYKEKSIERKKNKLISEEENKNIPKVCITCGVEKSVEEYKTNKTQCESCVKQWRNNYNGKNKERIRENRIRYEEENKDKLKEYQREYRKDNREKLNKYSEDYRNNLTKEELLEKNEKSKQYYQENKEIFKEQAKKRRDEMSQEEKDRLKEMKKENWNNMTEGEKDKIRKRRNERVRERIESNPSLKTLSSLRSRMLSAIKNGQGFKSGSSQELLGCDWETLIHHIEYNFAEGMSWYNYGEWHVDHIKPCASFDMSDPIEQKICFNYKNLQPLWAKDNQSKNDYWDIFKEENILHEHLLDEIKEELLTFSAIK